MEVRCFLACIYRKASFFRSRLQRPRCLHIRFLRRLEFFQFHMLMPKSLSSFDNEHLNVSSSLADSASVTSNKSFRPRSHVANKNGVLTGGISVFERLVQENELNVAVIGEREQYMDIRIPSSLVLQCLHDSYFVSSCESSKVSVLTD